MQAQYAQAWQRYEHHYLRINGQFAQVYPGVEEGLHTLATAGLPLACLTNKPLAFASRYCVPKAWKNIFSACLAAIGLPAKSPIRCRCWKPARPWAPRPSTLMVGDSSNNAQAARGRPVCRVVLMTYGFNHGEPIAAVPALAHWDALAQVQGRLSPQR